MSLLHLMGWELWYFNYWLTHLFYFAAGLIIIFAISSNKWNEYKRKILILKRLEQQTKEILPFRREVVWPLNQ